MTSEEEIALGKELDALEARPYASLARWERARKTFIKLTLNGTLAKHEKKLRNRARGKSRRSRTDDAATLGARQLLKDLEATGKLDAAGRALIKKLFPRV